MSASHIANIETEVSKHCAKFLTTPETEFQRYLKLLDGCLQDQGRFCVVFIVQHFFFTSVYYLLHNNFSGLIRLFKFGWKIIIFHNLYKDQYTVLLVPGQNFYSLSILSHSFHGVSCINPHVLSPLLFKYDSLCYGTVPVSANAEKIKEFIIHYTNVRTLWFL